MTGFDIAVMAIMLLSLLLGVWRGLVYEVLSLLGWPLAFVVSRMFAADVVPMMPGVQEALRIVLAYAAVFVVTLLAWGVLVWMLAKLLKSIGLGWLDKLLGGVFGIVRGALVVLALVWLAGLTQIPEQSFWRNAQTSRAAEGVAMWSKVWLPDSIAQRIHYGIHR